MAIAFDTALHQKVTTQTNTVSITLGASANYLLAFALVFPTETATAPTWNGVSMTQFAQVTSGGLGFVMYGWWLAAPATGTHDLVSTQSLNVGHTFYLMGLSYAGVSQSAPDTSNSFSGTWTSSPQTQILTTSANNCWMATYVLDDQSGLTASTNSTLRSVILDGAVGGFDSNGPITPAGSFSMSQTGTTGSTVAYGAVSAALAPFVVVTSVPSLSLLGTGT
jgi:hypothetical protein